MPSNRPSSVARSRYRIPSSVRRTWAGGSSSNGSSSVFTHEPRRAYGHAAKLCVTKRRTAAASAAAIRWSVPSVRRRFVLVNAWSKRRGLNSGGIAVSSWTITSGAASATAPLTASRSSASTTVGVPPAASSARARSTDLVVPVTSCPRRISDRTSGDPIAPVAPATKTRMSFLPFFLPLGQEAERGVTTQRRGSRRAPAAFVLHRISHARRDHRCRGRRAGSVPAGRTARRSTASRSATPRVLAEATTRLAIDRLQSARVRRERYVGPWLPEPLVGDSEPDVAERVELSESVSMAFLVVLERLSSVERAVFLLHGRVRLRVPAAAPNPPGIHIRKYRSPRPSYEHWQALPRDHALSGRRER